jgi:hypothetical protein
LEREAVLAERFEKLKSEADVKKAMREVKWVFCNYKAFFVLVDKPSW